MKVTKVFYCKQCLAPYQNNVCPLCHGTRDLDDMEQVYKRAIIKVLQAHRSEFFSVVEAEKRGE